ncbi:nitrite reductase [Metarhizium album ARSEF 1941]|uniref:Nitrite reductase n=1 Tax=Metarhizium album (strain ARSEF 1941) TaxID=1081103 RepID=A0A0B2X8Z8_METAS|nr:nitrite reductase [Metarhizium album ARSEF 1941]KHO01751.1 nitrite reductase [Metarhizium album ARSEF 1941]
MKELVAGYFDEWAEAISNPDMVARFKQFQNTADAADNMETEQDTGQWRPVYWPREAAAQDFSTMQGQWSCTAWEPVIETAHFDGADELPNGIPATVKRGDTQLAVWRFRGKYYATRQVCPHKRAFVLSDGLVGHDPTRPCSDDAEHQSAAPASAPWISCPNHKRNFDLVGGSCSSDGSLSIATFSAEPRGDGLLYIKPPPLGELDTGLGTTRWRVRKGESGDSPFAELDKKVQLLGRKSRKVNGIKPAVDGPVNGINRTGSETARPAVMAGCGSAPDW